MKENVKQNHDIIKDLLEVEYYLRRALGTVCAIRYNSIDATYDHKGAYRLADMLLTKALGHLLCAQKSERREEKYEQTSNDT
jgi:hypothetical protein